MVTSANVPMDAPLPPSNILLGPNYFRDPSDLPKPRSNRHHRKLLCCGDDDTAASGSFHVIKSAFEQFIAPITKSFREFMDGFPTRDDEILLEQYQFPRNVTFNDEAVIVDGLDADPPSPSKQPTKSILKKPSRHTRRAVYQENIKSLRHEQQSPPIYADQTQTQQWNYGAAPQQMPHILDPNQIQQWNRSHTRQSLVTTSQPMQQSQSEARQWQAKPMSPLQSISPASLETTASPAMSSPMHPQPIQVPETAYAPHQATLRHVNPLSLKCPIADAVPARLTKPEPFWNELFNQSMTNLSHAKGTMPSIEDALQIVQWVLSVPLPPQVDCSGIIPVRAMNSPSDKRLTWFYTTLAQQWKRDFFHHQHREPTWVECNELLWPSLNDVVLPDMSPQAIDRVRRLRDYHAYGCMPRDIRAALGHFPRALSSETRQATSYTQKAYTHNTHTWQGKVIAADYQMSPHISPSHMPPQSQFAQVHSQWQPERMAPRPMMQQPGPASSSNIQRFSYDKVSGNDIVSPQPERCLRHGPPPAPAEPSWPARQMQKIGTWLSEKFPQAGARSRTDPLDRYLDQLDEARRRNPELEFEFPDLSQ
eukprot:Blabericola_migrator_1__10079@NODE_559_length_7595_cov_6_567880_g419_i0_p1_GENE_NODE_559_length_7595_cov_6_567880_g419_i0NODE_559_length_7595_cov_6_567880_g419_i0_p1_ORF_typecomplete_len592_score72_83_NODE_559_length_7595_cov_6_567880_g419_i029724747